MRNTPSSEPLPPATASSQASCPSEILADPEGSYHGSTTTEEEPSYSSNLPPLRSAHPHAHAHPLKSFAVPAIPASSHPSFESPALPSAPLLTQTGKQQHAQVSADYKTANWHPSCSEAGKEHESKVKWMEDELCDNHSLKPTEKLLASVI